jgi:outer membrane lipoprotein-sorting protein
MFRQAFSIAFLFFLNGTAFGQTAPSADELAARNIAARGGIERIRAFHSMSGSGTMLLPNGMEVPVTLYLKRPGLMRIEAAIQGKSMVVAFDGTDSWTINALTGSGEPQKASEAESNRVREDSTSMLDGELVDYKDKGSQLAFAGNEDVLGRPAYKLKVTTKFGTVHYIYLDAETFRRCPSFSCRLVAAAVSS